MDAVLKQSLISKYWMETGFIFKSSESPPSLLHLSLTLNQVKSVQWKVLGASFQEKNFPEVKSNVNWRGLGFFR